MKQRLPILFGAGIAIAALVLSGTFSTSEETAQTAFEARAIELEQLSSQPDADLEVSIALINLYLQTVEQTADVSLYQKAASVADEAERQFGAGHQLIASQSQIALGQHRFSDALELILLAVEAAPDVSAYYAIKGDVLLALGLYSEAVDAYQILSTARPGFAAYSRVAYMRELYGQSESALAMWQQAFVAAPNSQQQVWVLNELARATRAVEISSSSAYVQQALVIDPDYVPALRQKAELAYFAGDIEAALAAATKAFALQPGSTEATLLGDLYAVTGDLVRAEQHYTLTELAFKASAELGQSVAVDQAVFEARRNRISSTTLAVLQAAQTENKSVSVIDAYVRALVATGAEEEARSIITAGLQSKVAQNDPWVQMSQVGLGLLDAELLQPYGSILVFNHYQNL